MSEEENRETDRLEELIRRTGIAPFSIRTRWLRKLALSDDPVLSTAAFALLADRGAKLYGALYEALTVYCLPAVAVLLYFAYRAEALYQPIIGAALKTWTSVAGFLLLGAIILGCLVTVLPGCLLLRTEGEGDSLRLGSYQPGKVLESLSKVQWWSIVVPWFYYIGFMVASNIAISHDPAICDRWTVMCSLISWPVIVSYVITFFILALALGAAGIYSAMSFRRIWLSFIVTTFLGFLYLAFIALFPPAAGALVDLFDIYGATPTQASAFYLPVGAFIAFLVMRWMARRAVQRRVLAAR